MSRAWDAAVNAEFMEKLKALAEAYPNEKELLQDLENFGGDVYELLYQTEELEFRGEAEQGKQS